MGVLLAIIMLIFKAFVMVGVAVLVGRTIYKVTKKEGFSIFSGFVSFILIIVFVSYHNTEILNFLSL